MPTPGDFKIAKILKQKFLLFFSLSLFSDFHFPNLRFSCLTPLVFRMFSWVVPALVCFSCPGSQPRFHWASGLGFPGSQPWFSYGFPSFSLVPAPVFTPKTAVSETQVSDTAILGCHLAFLAWVPRLLGHHLAQDSRAPPRARFSRTTSRKVLAHHLAQDSRAPAL